MGHPTNMNPPLRVVLWGVFDTPLQGDNKKRRTDNKKAGYALEESSCAPGVFLFSFFGGATSTPMRPQQFAGAADVSSADVGDRNNIGKHTRCGHVGTGAVALDNHRILVITLGGDHNNVVASLQFVERMGATNFL